MFATYLRSQDDEFVLDFLIQRSAPLKGLKPKYQEAVVKLYRAIDRRCNYLCKPTPTQYDMLFLKYSHHLFLDFDKKNAKAILQKSNFEFCVKPSCITPGDDTIKAPHAFPIPHAFVHRRKAYETKLMKPCVWTGRMRYRRGWQLEYQQGDEFGWVTQAKRVDNIRRIPRDDHSPLAMWCPAPWGDGRIGHFKRATLYCKAFRDWVDYSEILDQMFRRVEKEANEPFTEPAEEARQFFRR